MFFYYPLVLMFINEPLMVSRYSQQNPGRVGDALALPGSQQFRARCVAQRGAETVPGGKKGAKSDGKMSVL